MSEEMESCPVCGALPIDQVDSHAVGQLVRVGYKLPSPMTALTTPPAGEEERRVHELKTWPPYFGAVKRGEKPFEIRKNDRDYRVGDWLRLCEWLPAVECYTGEEHEAQITYVLDGGSFGLEPGFCVLGLSSPRVEEVRREAFEEAAAIARAHRDKSPEYGTTLRIWSRACAQIEDAIRARLRSLGG